MNPWLVVSVPLAALGCTGCSPSDLPQQGLRSDQAVQLPDSWVLSDITNAALIQDESAIDRDVLVWHIKRDGRLLLVESCIAWLHVKTANGNLIYRVSYVYRHPKWHNRWEVAAVEDAPIPFEEEWDHPPASGEILDFIERTEWNWQLDEGDGGFIVGSGIPPARRSSRRSCGLFVQGAHTTPDRDQACGISPPLVVTALGPDGWQVTCGGQVLFVLYFPR